MRSLVLVLEGVLVIGCDGATSDPGAGALMQVPGAQFVEGAPPDDDGGPGVASFGSTRPGVLIGTAGQRLRAALEEGARTGSLYLVGDDGHWVLPAGAPASDTPDLPSLDVRVGFAADLDPGPIELEARAVGADGRSGEPLALGLIAEEVPLPDGALVVTLAWEGAADLDLHVVMPDDEEVWAGNPNSYEPPGPGELPDPPGEWETGGIYTGDAGCGGGARRESVVWAAYPPPGQYVVRVDAFSLCGGASSYWEVEAVLEGESLGRAEGVALPSDADLPHGRGAGVTALGFGVSAMPEE